MPALQDQSHGPRTHPGRGGRGRMAGARWSAGTQPFREAAREDACATQSTTREAHPKTLSGHPKTGAPQSET